MSKSFCLYCGKLVDYVKVSTPRTFFVRGTRVEFDEITAHCVHCKRELYVYDINDLNVDNRLKAYQKAVKEQNE